MDEIAELRREVRQLTGEVASLRELIVQGRPLVISLADRRHYDREAAVTLTGEERRLLALTLKQTSRAEVRGELDQERRSFWQTRLGRLAVVVTILSEIVVAIAAVHPR